MNSDKHTPEPSSLQTKSGEFRKGAVRWPTTWDANDGSEGGNAKDRNETPDENDEYGAKIADFMPMTARWINDIKTAFSSAD